MKSSLIVIILITLSLKTIAHDPASAARDLKIDYSFYEEKTLSLFSLENANEMSKTALGTSAKYEEGTLPHATVWRSLAHMQKRFEAIRDERFLVWKKGSGILRRSSWLYPDDGCFARAALANRNLFRWFLPVPNKVFAFGNLRVKTNNSPRGVVGWWYHVAPIVEVNNQKYVLDPAIERSRPLILKEWLSRMGNPEKMKVAICSSGTYSPGDRCDKETEGLELRAERAQQHYLNKEWMRMVQQGREAEL